MPSENNLGSHIDNPNVVQLPKFTDGGGNDTDIRPVGPFDAWLAPNPWNYVDPNTGIIGTNDAIKSATGPTPIKLIDPSRGGWYRIGDDATRIGDDVLLTNVIGFDVKAWDPNAAVLVQKIPDPSDPNKSIDEIVSLPGDPGYPATVERLRHGGGDMDYTTGAYVDLNYMARLLTEPNAYPDYPYMFGTTVGLPIPHFAREGNHRSLAYGTVNVFANYKQPFDYYPAVYDTWSLHYEYNHQWVNYVSENPADSNRVDPSTTSTSTGFVGDEDRDGTYDEATDGLDNNNANGVDDIGERETQPPYNVPLQGIQIRIRVFEPGSRQVREVTLVQKFRTK